MVNTFCPKYSDTGRSSSKNRSALCVENSCRARILKLLIYFSFMVTLYIRGQYFPVR